MAFLTIKHLWKYYNQAPVLENLSLSIDKGSFCTIVGASGCGKSTFLRILLGQESASKGTIILEDHPLRNEPDAERGIVFQRYSLYPHLTVRDNVVLGMEFEQSRLFSRLFGAKKRAAYQQVDEILEIVGLAHAARRYPDELSGGMQQRASIAQALVKKPPMLLLDEPFGALDPGTTNDMHDLILRLWKEKQLTIFMVTHDISEAFKLGTRVLVFDKVRVDPHDPQAYGATITYDIPLDKQNRNIEKQQFVHEAPVEVAPPSYNLKPEPAAPAS